MPLMPRFSYHRPDTLEEALQLLAEHQASATVLAGGTDLINKLRDGRASFERVVSLNRVRGLDRIDYDEGTGLTVGAGARISDVAKHPAVREHYPTLAQACSVMATTQIRNMATVAGNLANASPCADTAGPLLIHDAELSIVHSGGRRQLPLANFYRGPGETNLEAGEIVETITVPRPPRAGSAYLRLSARSSVDMAAVIVSGLLVLDSDGRVSRARLALGAVAPTPMRCAEAEDLLMGRKPEVALFERAAESCGRAARPIDDVRAPASYRRAMVIVLARRVLERCAATAEGGER